MICPNCGTELKDTASFCNMCGFALKSKVTEEPAAAETPVTAQEPAVTEAPVAAQEPAVTESPVAAEEPVVTEAPVTTEAPVASEAPVAEPVTQSYTESKKPALKIKPVFIIAAVAVLIVIIGVVFRENLVSAAAKVFMSDDEYYRYVEEKSIKEYSAAYAERMGALIDCIKDDNINYNYEVSVELGKEGKDLLENFTSSFKSFGLDDLGWFDCLALSGSVQMSKSALDTNTSVKLNKETLFTFNALLDTKEESAAFGLPGLTDKYVGAEMGTEASKEIGDAFAQAFEIYDIMPSEKDLEKIISSYATAVFDAVEDVKVDKATVSVGDIEVKCKEYTYNVDSDLLALVLDNIAEIAEDDEVIEELFNSYMNILKERYPYSDFSDYSYKSVIKELKDYAKKEGSRNEDYGKVKVYIDGKGEIVGRKFQLKVDDEKVTINVLTPTSGSNAGIEISVNAYSADVFSIKGNGKLSSGKFTGDLKCKYMGSEVAKISLDSFDIKGMSKGNLSGSITVTAGKGISDLGLSSSVAGILEDYSLKLTFDCKNLKSGLKAAVYEGKDMIVTLGLNFEISKGGKMASYPSDNQLLSSEDDDDMDEFVDSISFKNVIKSLEKADAPDEIVDFVEDLEDTDVNKWDSLFYQYLYGY